jgi:uncharacterized BrkB/YihY/UPF0761 family membrane protein
MNTALLVRLIRQTFADWSDDKAPRLGAALAYYAIFSIPPLILLVISSVSLVYRGDVAGALEHQIGSLVGNETARDHPSTSAIAVGFARLVSHALWCCSPLIRGVRRFRSTPGCNEHDLGSKT